MTAWTEDDTTRCIGWSAAQHAEVAAELLDSNCVPTFCEDTDGNDPPHRYYSINDTEARRGEEPDYAPYMAALVHSQLALFKQRQETK